jgi:N-methylhydantoinase A/oxoprolinase/acetone carboxylase beta subunit
MRETYLFRQGAVFGAYGSSGMDIMHVYETRVDLPGFDDRASRNKICRQLNLTVAALQRTAFKDMRGEGFSPEEIRFELEMELNSSAPETPIRISLPNPFIWPARDWATLVQHASDKIGGRKALEESHARISKVFLRALIDVPHAAIVPPNPVASGNDAYKGRRQIYTGRERSVEAPVYEWNLLSVPTVVVGPALIESQDTTVVVPPHMTIRFDAEYNGVIRQEGRGK